MGRPHYDFIIVGLGLAGAVLSFKLLQRGKKILVVDPDEEVTSSKIAGGMWNPIVFKRINKCWNADVLLPEAMKCYSELETFIDTKILHPMRVVKIFPNAEYANDFHMKSCQEGFKDLLSVESNNAFDQRFGEKYSYGCVVQSGRVDLSTMLKGLKKKLIDQGSYLQSEVLDSEIEKTQGGLLWKGNSADQVILARGHKECESELFGWLPLNKTKGEMIDLETDEEPIPDIINNSQFIIPNGRKSVRIGSTYDHNFDSIEPTDLGKERILEKVQSFLGPNYKIAKHQAGIRPTSSDRKPVVGPHPEIDGLSIFNGMGTRGVLNAPWCADQLFNKIIDFGSIDKEIDLTRFKRR